MAKEAGKEADFAPVRFSTGDLPARDRLAIYREEFGRKIVRVDIEPLQDQPFHAEATLRRLPGLRMLDETTSGARTKRSGELLADGDDDIAIIVCLRGGGVFTQRSREATLQPKQAVTLMAAEPSETLHPHHNGRMLVAKAPHAALTPLVTNVEEAVIRPIPHDTEALRLLVSYIAAVRKELPLTQPELRHLAVTHVHDLIALAIGATRDGTALAEARGLSAARLKAIKADIIANLGRHDLSLNLISQRQHLSTRHIRRLFRAEDTSFSDFVLEQRLVRANHMLGGTVALTWQ